MLLIADISETPIRFIGIVDSFEESIQWYKTHTRFTPKLEKDYIQRLADTWSGEKEWIPFRKGGNYAVHWVHYYPNGTFKRELTSKV